MGCILGLGVWGDENVGVVVVVLWGIDSEVEGKVVVRYIVIVVYGVGIGVEICLLVFVEVDGYFGSLVVVEGMNVVENVMVEIEIWEIYLLERF